MNSITCFLGLNLSTSCFLLSLFQCQVSKKSSLTEEKGVSSGLYCAFVYSKFRVRDFKERIYAVVEKKKKKVTKICFCSMILD